MSSEVNSDNIASKQMRRGTYNSGYDYEKLVPAYFALELLKDKNVKTFEFEMNSSSFGKFDDLIIKSVCKDNTIEQFAIQLKHREEGNNKLQAVHEFKRRDNKKKGKAFNILDYLKAFRQQNEANRKNYKWILFTNAEFDDIEKVEDFRITTKTPAFQTNLFNTAGILQFEDMQLTSTNVEEEFCRNFFLISKQKNVKEMEEAINKAFVEILHSDNRMAVCYIDLFQHLHKGNYDNRKIDKNAVILNLTYLLLSNWIVTPSISKDQNTKIELIEEAMTKFDLVILRDCESAFIEKNWKYITPKTSADYIKQGRELKLLKSRETPVENLIVLLLCFLEGKPLFLRSTAESEKIIYSISSLLRTLENHQMKLVILGKNFQQSRFQHWNILQDLRDLSLNNFLYQALVKELKISLQGREAQALETLSSKYDMNFDQLVTPNECFRFLTGDVMIGEKFDDLPEHYIPRTLLKSNISLKKLKKICAKKTVVVHCEYNSKQFEQVLQNNGFQIKVTHLSSFELNDSRQEPTLILTDKPEIKYNQKSYYHLKLIQGNLLQWMENKVDPSSSSVYESQVNILYGPAGIGKTVLMKYLAQNCPPTYWVSTIPLQKINSFFKQADSAEDALTTFLDSNEDSELTRRFYNYFKREKKIIFFFDGLDELNSNSILQAVDAIEQVVGRGYKVWVSSRTYLKCLNKGFFEEAPAYTIENVSKLNQEQYINKRLKKVGFKDETIDRIKRNIFNNSTENNDILEVPLFLYLLTEILTNREQFTQSEERLSLIQMYSSFLEGQFQHSLEKTKCTTACSTLSKLDMMLKILKDYFFNDCQVIALYTCLESDLLTSIEVKTNTKFQQYAKDGGSFFGFIKTDKNNRFVFTHRTFAEYFVAIWLNENLERIPLSKRDFILKPTYAGIRRFFDAVLAEKCILHLAIIDQDISRVRAYVISCWNQVDRVERTPLHVAVTVGQRPLFDSEKGRKETYDSASIKNRFGDEILKNLLNNAKPEDLSKKDKFLGWTPLEYADASFNLFALEEFSKLEELHWQVLKTCEQHLSYFVYFCVTKGYINLLKLAIKEKGMTALGSHCEERPLLHLALEFNQEEIAMLLIERKVHITQTDSRGQTPLHQAAISGQAKIVKLLLSKDVDLEAKDNLGRTAMHLAAKMDHIVVMEELHKRKAEVNAIDGEGKTPLHKAAYMGRTASVKYLIDIGADIDALHCKSKSSLHRAAAMGHYATVQCLVENGAKKDLRDNAGKTALHYAVHEGHERVVDYLVSQEVNIATIDEDGKTPIEIAAERGYTNILKILKKAQSGYSPRASPPGDKLHEAAQKGDLETIEHIVNSGAKIEETNRDLETALHIASRFGHLHVVKFLLTKRVNAAATNHDGRTALHLAAQYGYANIVKELLDEEQNIAVDRWGLTPLHRAAYKGHVQVVQIFIKDVELDPNLLSNEDTTPLHSAARGGHIHMIEYLIKNGGNIFLKNSKGETCLHVAIKRGCTEVAECLIDIDKSIINEVDYSGRTALHFAVHKGYKSLVRMLVQKGADINKKDCLNESPLETAISGDRLDIVRYLQP